MGLALLCRETAQRALRHRSVIEKAVSAARAHGRVRYRTATVRAFIRPCCQCVRLASGRACLGSARCTGTPSRSFPWRLFCPQFKHSGAWMTSLGEQENPDGDIRPLVVNVMNFAKAGEGEPVLLS